MRTKRILDYEDLRLEKSEEGVKDLVAISPPGDDGGRLPLHLGRESKTWPSCFKRLKNLMDNREMLKSNPL